jgi:thioredoxin 1
MEHTFTDANFEAEVLQSPMPVAVDFWAEWCGPCRVMGPIVEEISGEIDQAKLKIGKLNVDQNGETSMKYGILSIPTILIFKNGQVADQIVGSMSKDALKERLVKYAV